MKVPMVNCSVSLIFRSAEIAGVEQETDTLSIRLNDKPSTESEEIAPDVVIDFDEAGGVVGLEIDLASASSAL